MNSSGNAVSLLNKKYVDSEYILVHDDLDIPLGSFKINMSKSLKDIKG